ncbi:hypothetical protein D3C84_417740 [compost metagenome]
MHGHIPQQRIEAQLRGHHVHGPQARQQLGRVDIARQHLDPWLVSQRRQVEMPALAAGDHVRMHLEQDRAGGIARQGRLEHRPEVGGAGALQRGIGEGLVGHQHTVGGQVGVFDAGVVVLGHPLLLPQLLQRRGTQGVGIVQGEGNQLLQARRRAGIVVHADVIDDQRQRWLVSAQAHGTQEAVFQCEDGSIGFRRLGHGLECAGFAPPRHHAVGLRHVAHSPVVRRVIGQQRGQRGNALSTLGEDQQARAMRNVIHKRGAEIH